MRRESERATIMDEDLKTYLDARFDESRTETRAMLDESRTETRAMLDESRTETRAMFDDSRAESRTETRAIENSLMERIAGRLDAVESRLRDFIAEADRDLETKIVGEFWKWGRTSDIRTRQALTESSLLNERMLSVEDRISALERQKAS
jgi:hypothetical protein